MTMANHGDTFWNGFSNMAETLDRGRVVFVDGDGCYLTDTEGNRYFDASGGLWYNAVGHGRQEIADAIGAQAARLAACTSFDVYSADVTLAVADRIADLTTIPDPRVFLTSGGSDSVDSAGKIIRRYFALRGEPERNVIIAREGAYHGMHAYGTALAGIPANHDPWGDLVPEVEHITAFNAEALEERIAAVGAERVAAFIAEPVIGAGGVFPPPDGYLPAVAEVCRRHGVLLVCDEVVTGVGRMGSWTASERYGVQPDLMTLAKVLTSGYQPLGAVVVSGTVAEPFFAGEGAWLKHGYTYSGHATACAAAMANLDIIEEERLVERVAALEPELPRLLGPLADLDAVEEVRTAGLLAAV
jgi:adenosylmethionine-8-amino-7-oxononanoate aminotransferase